MYDIGLLPPLFQTAASCFANRSTAIDDDEHDLGNYFVLAHVPRACYNSENPPVDDLENHIVERAQGYGFALVRLLRPTDVAAIRPENFPPAALNRMSLQEMEEIGAAIFIFRKAN